MASDNTEGAIFYLLPMEQEANVEQIGSRVSVGGKPTRVNRPVKNVNDQLPRSSQHPTMQAVYRDGILLSDLSSSPSSFNSYLVAPPYLRVNLQAASKTDIARTKVIEDERWDRKLRKLFLNHLMQNEQDSLLSLSTEGRFHRLGWLSVTLNISSQEILERFPSEKIPVMVLQKGGHIEFWNWSSFIKNDTPIVPENLEVNIHDLYINRHKPKSSATSWMGEALPILLSDSLPVRRSLVGRAASIAATILARSHHASRVRFLKSHPIGKAPLLQLVYTPNLTQPLTAEELLKEASNEAIFENSQSRSLLATLLSFAVYEFSEPFASAYACGNYHNYKHPITISVIKILSRIQLARRRGELSPQAHGRLWDLFLRFKSLYSRFQQKISAESMQNGLNDLLSAAREAGVWQEDDKLVISSSEIVPYFGPIPLSLYGHRVQDWGEVLRER